MCEDWRGETRHLSLSHNVSGVFTSCGFPYLPLPYPKGHVAVGPSGLHRCRVFTVWVEAPAQQVCLAAALCPMLFLGWQYLSSQTSEVEQPS